jgi:ribosomal protein S18 acetylase RimI-like enzyme
VSDLLARHVWHALTTRQAHFAEGTGRARRFVADISPFAATADDSPEAVADLGRLIPAGGSAILLQAEPTPFPEGVTGEGGYLGVQMVARSVTAPEPSPDVIDLGDGAAAEMLALATLTQPGPFQVRTHLMGNFVGIRRDGRLVAMAGERMKLPGYTEVSAVCTHPDERRRGFASLLSRVVSARIMARGETPFLHAFASNHAAIRLYEKLGFVHTRKVWGAFLKRA